MRTPFIAGLLLISTVATAQLRNQLDSLMRATTQLGKPGAALLVERNGKTFYQAGFGLANVAKSASITPETNFRMASVSKQFTAMGILLLEKAGKLSLNDPLVRFFPEFTKQVAQKVQLKHLLTHSSGILDYEVVMNPNQHQQLLDADVLTLLKNRDTLYFEPGTQFRYSNSGFCLLALIIERASGQSFATYLRQHIFQPLNMRQTVVYEAGKPIFNRAMGYRQQGNHFIFSDQSVTSATKGDGGVYTSLSDYKRWIDALQTNRLINLSETLARTKLAIPAHADSYYAAGWFFSNPEKPVLFHSGSTCGFNNFVVYIPSQKFLMAYFANRANNKANAAAVLQLLATAEQHTLADLLKLDELTQ